MTNARSIQGIIVLICALVAAIWLGLSIVTNQTETILQIFGVILLIACFAMGKRIWLLIPFTVALSLSLRLPGQPSSLLLGQLLVIGFTFILFLTRKIDYRFRKNELDVWILILTGFVLQVYLRNPVGVSLFGGGTVGGKAYAIYVLTLLSTLILSGISVPLSDLKWIFRISVIGGILNFIISLTGTFVPIVGYMIQLSFERSDEVNHENIGQAVDSGAATRISFTNNLSKNLAIWIAACVSPIKVLLSPKWGILAIIAVASAVLSGYRNGVGYVGLTFLLGILYRGGFSGFIASLLAASAGLALLAGINLVSPLPPNVQRSLTFLPGTWDDRYKQDTEVSDEWRFEIWQEVLLTDRWIQNKWFGDGLGFSAAELAAQINSREGVRAGISGFDAHRESILASGDYHSGPVQTIRVIGYFGLLVLLIAQIRLAVSAHRLTKKYRNSEWYPTTLLIGIPIIISPIFFVFIFGTFASASSSLLVGYGMIRLLQNNLPLPKTSNSTFSTHNGFRKLLN
jgi:hypothetical protein